MQNVTFDRKDSVPDRCNFSGKIKIGYATTLGYNNFLAGDITIGKYCQLGADVALHATTHPMNYMTTYVNKNLFNGELKTLKQENKIIIGNDVWMGHGVIVVVGNVTVGNGAILAAGIVVTKDVAPYAIVAGVPAKEKKRFSDTIIQEIEALDWWNLSEQELEKIKPLILKDFTNRRSIYD